MRMRILYYITLYYIQPETGITFMPINHKSWQISSWGKKPVLEFFHSCSYEQHIIQTLIKLVQLPVIHTFLSCCVNIWNGFWKMALCLTLSCRCQLATALAWECWMATGWWKAMEVVWIKTLIHMSCTETAKPTNSSLAHDPCHADEEHHTPNVQHAADLRRGRMAVRF